MTKSLFLLFLFYGQIAFADNLSGCLSKGGAGRLIIDKSCDCVKNKTCATFKPKKLSKELYDSEGINKNKTFSSLEKNKLQESYDLFYKIMELKASGQGKSDEIKSLYIKLDKLNLDVRKSLLKNHSADYATFKKSYSKDQGDRKKRNEKMLKRIGVLIKNDSQLLANNPEKIVESPTEVINEQAAAVENSPSANMASVPSAVSPVVASIAKEENQFILENIKPKKLQRSNDDSLFEIITKSYQRAAYPILLAP